MKLSLLSRILLPCVVGYGVAPIPAQCATLTWASVFRPPSTDYAMFSLQYDSTPDVATIDHVGRTADGFGFWIAPKPLIEPLNVIVNTYSSQVFNNQPHAFYNQFTKEFDDGFNGRFDQIMIRELSRQPWPHHVLHPDGSITIEPEPGVVGSRPTGVINYVNFAVSDALVSFTVPLETLNVEDDFYWYLIGGNFGVSTPKTDFIGDSFGNTQRRVPEPVGFGASLLAALFGVLAYRRLA